MNFNAEQQRLHSLLNEQARCVVRVCDGSHALWVSDLPRRINVYDETSNQLRQAGYDVKLDQTACLWLIDWTWKRWQKLLAGLPENCPSMPDEEALHEGYALCRLWLMHPSALKEEHLPMLRKIVKLTAQPKDRVIRAIRALHEETAVLLRTNESIPYAAGRVLSAWLVEQMNGKEMQL